MPLGVRLRHLPPLLLVVVNVLSGGIWCSGSTRDFESLSLGSIPSIPSIIFELYSFRRIRARCMDLTVNQWLDWFDPSVRSKYNSISFNAGIVFNG